MSKLFLIARIKFVEDFVNCHPYRKNRTCLNWSVAVACI